jgi:hypothetical protein
MKYMMNEGLTLLEEHFAKTSNKDVVVIRTAMDLDSLESFINETNIVANRHSYRLKDIKYGKDGARYSALIMYEWFTF